MNVSISIFETFRYDNWRTHHAPSEAKSTFPGYFGVKQVRPVSNRTGNTLKRFEYITTLSEENRSFVFRIIDMVIKDLKIRQAYVTK